MKGKYEIILIVIFFTTSFCNAITFSIQKTEKISVYFKFNESVLDDNSKSKIDSIIRKNNIEHIYLQGHCDSIGSNAYNDALSTKRVLEVKQYLVSKNINENLIEIKALGKRMPLNKNENEKARALNRRVEIEFAIKNFKSVAKSKKTTASVPNKKINTDTIKNSPIPETLTKEVEITGIVLDEKKRPIVAEISLNDKNGKEILNALSGKDGKYKFKATLNKKEDYSLIYYNDETFIDAKTINISNPKLPFRNLTIILPKLKGGNKYILKNMNFVGDTSQLIPSSLPSLFTLYKLMKKNKSLVIRIEGHVNFPKYWDVRKYESDSLYRVHYHPPGINHEEFCQWLSNERAKMVYNYLVSTGIDPKRMSAIGYGASKMLFPNAKTADEMEQNRRVEINVISFKK